MQRRGRCVRPNYTVDYYINTHIARFLAAMSCLPGRVAAGRRSCHRLLRCTFVYGCTIPRTRNKTPKHGPYVQWDVLCDAG